MRFGYFSLCCAVTVAGCGSSGDMRLYPLEGPLAALDPPAVIVLKAANPENNSGSLKFRLPDRTRCEGTWSSVVPRSISRTRGLNLSLRRPGAEISNTTEEVPGVNRGEIYAVCTDNTRIQGSFVMGSGTNSGTGTATDTNGNVYKLLF
jgi:hypothetical protein